MEPITLVTLHVNRGFHVLESTQKAVVSMVYFLLLFQSEITVQAAVIHPARR